MFLAEVFIISKNGIQPKCPWNKPNMFYLYNGILYSNENE